MQLEKPKSKVALKKKEKLQESMHNNLKTSCLIVS